MQDQDATGAGATRGEDVDESRLVAVIGMACRLPGADTIEDLWRVLRDGVDATSETPSDRYDVASIYSASRERGTIGSRRGGYAAGIADFDADFFALSPAEAAALDPQQRLLLMATWEALEDAGQRPDLLAGSRTGVFVGNARADFLERQFRQGLEQASADAYNNFRSMLPARLSHSLDLRGPSMTVDTACSSSLTAVHLAVQSLRLQQVPLAVVAGVNLPLRADEGVVMTQAGTMSADGRSRFGDGDADGFAPSDGLGVVILKPLVAARADGDRIRAVIRGSAVGNDGGTSEGLLRPSLAGQVDILQQAYEDARVDPADVDFVEAHGSGSPMHDPLELTALGQVLGAGRPADRPCLVGSVKTNVGHAEAAAGIVGLIKAVLCLEHDQVPASLHHDHPHPQVDWSSLPIKVPTGIHRLPDRGRPHLAGITGQGGSTLNAHVVIAQGEEQSSVEPPSASEPEDSFHTLTLTANSAEAMDALVGRYVDYLSTGRGATFALRDICHSAATRRALLPYRLTVTGASHAEMIIALETASLPDEPDTEFIPGHDSPGRFVPLPTYPWQCRRYWPGEPAEAQGTGDLASSLLRLHARTSVDALEEGTLLSEIGIDSLARLEITVGLAEDYAYETDPEELASLRTVGDLRGWVGTLEAQR